MALALELSDVRAAAERLRGHAHRTPVLTSHSIDEPVGGRVLLKAENLQRVGAFKFRGAYNAVARLSPEAAARGICTASSGNHAQAVALAARLHGLAATILMPRDAPASKLEATRAHGADVIAFDRFTGDREELLAELSASSGMTVVHPFDNHDVMAGQGTVALELLDDHPDLDLLVAPVGGGGLISGCAVAAKALSPAIRMIGVEPAAGDDTRRSLQAGERVRIPIPETIADGQQAPTPGEKTFPIVRELVDEVVTVTDEEIIATMQLLFRRLKIVVEPSGATALAAILTGRVDVTGRVAGAVLSGGNVDIDRFCALTA